MFASTSSNFSQPSGIDALKLDRCPAAAARRDMADAMELFNQMVQQEGFLPSRYELRRASDNLAAAHAALAADAAEVEGRC